MPPLAEALGRQAMRLRPLQAILVRRVLCVGHIRGAKRQIDPMTA